MTLKLLLRWYYYYICHLEQNISLIRKDYRSYNNWNYGNLWKLSRLARRHNPLHTRAYASVIVKHQWKSQAFRNCKKARFQTLVLCLIHPKRVLCNAFQVRSVIKITVWSSCFSSYSEQGPDAPDWHNQRYVHYRSCNSFWFQKQPRLSSLTTGSTHYFTGFAPYFNANEINLNIYFRTHTHTHNDNVHTITPRYWYGYN